MGGAGIAQPFKDNILIHVDDPGVEKYAHQVTLLFGFPFRPHADLKGLIPAFAANHEPDRFAVALSNQVREKAPRGIVLSAGSDNAVALLESRLLGRLALQDLPDHQRRFEAVVRHGDGGRVDLDVDLLVGDRRVIIAVLKRLVRTFDGEGDRLLGPDFEHFLAVVEERRRLAVNGHDAVAGLQSGLVGRALGLDLLDYGQERRCNTERGQALGFAADGRGERCP